MKTIVELLESSAKKYANNQYLLEKRIDKYEVTTYRETKEQAYRVAAGFMALGLNKGDRVALLSEARTDWVISELGILHTGAVNIPLSIILKEGADLKFRIEHSESRWIIVSRSQLVKIKPIRKVLGVN
jgi:long-chain acyl-CoA synthetase